MTGSDSGIFRERRQSPRLDVLERLHVRFAAGRPDVEARTLSAGGFSVVCDTPFKVGEVHRFVIETKGTPTTTAIAARVVYSRRFSPGDADQFLTGFAFVTPDGRDLEKIDRLLDSLTGSLSFD